jgi:hypothetical protein
VVAGAAALLAGCTSTVGGQADGVAGRPVTPVPPTTGAAAPSSVPPSQRTNLCGLLTWHDLGYPGNEKAQSPTKVNTIQGAVASCSWITQEFKAGKTPPPEPSCNNDNTVTGSLACVGDDAQQFAEIENDSATIEVTVAYERGTPTRRPASYSQGGRTVYLNDQGTTCGGDTAWDGAAIAVAVTDTSKAYGPPCDELKKLMVLLIQREPHH